MIEKWLFGWVLGVMSLLVWHELPSPWLWLSIGVVAATLACCRGLSRRLALALPLAAFALSGAYATQVAGRQLADWLPAHCEPGSWQVRVRLAGLPEPMAQAGWRIAAEPLAPGPCWQAGTRWMLSWRDAPALRPGEVWLLQLRLRRPRGLVNPGAFDSERWWHQNGVTATGQIRAGQREQLAPVSLDGLRLAVRERLLAAFPEQPDAAGTVLALLTGDRAGMSDAAWERYARTGVTHLVAISGVHITMVAWLVGRIAAAGWARSRRLVNWQPVPRVAGLVGLLAAFAYGVLAGLELPAQRTLLMLGIITWMRWWPGEWSGWQMLLTALAVVLACDPLGVHAVGLWLSFAAVALLMLGGMAPGEEAGWRAALRAQWLATWGLLPLSLVVFARISWVSLPVNLLAIPWVTFAVVPTAMLGLLLHALWPEAGLALWALSVQLTVWLDAFLQQVADWPLAASRWSLPGLSGFWLLLAVACALLPRRLPGRLLALVFMLPVVFARPALREGELQMTVLDVGQGLAIHLQTRSHHALLDTGPPQGTRADAGSRVIVPYLAWAGVASLHRLILSHDDSDHSGGARSVLTALPVAAWLGPWPQAVQDAGLAPPGQRLDCVAGQYWLWDGVRFEVLWPLPNSPMASDNDNSCVLRITVAGQVLLLPGDLEAAGERGLLAAVPGEELKADLLVLGHHGSRTSTTPAFLAAVRPREVVATLGYRNRYRHPAPVVMARLRQAGIPGWRSDASGALRYRFGATESWPDARPQIWRVDEGGYWRRNGPDSGSALGALTAFPVE